MKTSLFCLLIVALISCSRNIETEITLNPSDAAAVTGMVQEFNNLLVTSGELASASTAQQKHHLDSIYHHHDSLFWHYHSLYNEINHHPHNDHLHKWVPYDHTIDHSHHFHPVYPHNIHDSLIVVPNGHHPHHTIHHSEIHSIHDHHRIDSLHNIHQVYHH